MKNSDKLPDWVGVKSHELFILDCISSLFKKHFGYSPFDPDSPSHFGDTFTTVSSTRVSDGLFIWRDFRCVWGKNLDRDSTMSRSLSDLELKNLLDECVDEIMRATPSDEMPP